MFGCTSQMQSAVLSVLCVLGMVLMLCGIYARETMYDKRVQCGMCSRTEDLRWRWRHSVRWSVVVLLLLEGLHHLQYTVLPSVQIGGDYVLGDVGLAVLGVLYGLSLLSHSYDVIKKGAANDQSRNPQTGV